MSINDVIDQIAITAEQKAQYTFLWLMSKFSGLLTPEETRPEDLSPERIQELDQRIRELGHLPPPRLTLDEINDILTDYPYQLPVEFNDLYQRGNGVLPLGVLLRLMPFRFKLLKSPSRNCMPAKSRCPLA